MKKITLILVVSVLSFSCEKHQDKIEIYLLNKNIQSSEGMPILEYKKLKKIKSETDSTTYKERNWNYDTINKQFISGGKFSVKEKDLQESPLIADENILKLDLEKSELILSEDGKKAISHLDPAIRNQFVICVNKQPILTGYFRYNFSSTVYSWNYIGYNRQSDKNIKLDTTFVIRQNPNCQKWKPILTDLTKYPKLVNAFKETGRLKE